MEGEYVEIQKLEAEVGIPRVRQTGILMKAFEVLLPESHKEICLKTLIL